MQRYMASGVCGIWLLEFKECCRRSWPALFWTMYILAAIAEHGASKECGPRRLRGSAPGASQVLKNLATLWT